MEKTLLELLAEDKNEKKEENKDIVRSTVTTNQRNQSLSALERFAEEVNNGMRYANAKNSHTTSKVLDMLSEDKMFFDSKENMRGRVAWNENTPSEVFATLVSDKNITINFYGREITLKNLVELAHSKCVEDRISVARYDAPPRILALLATDEDPRVRETVAWNKFTPAKLLRTLTYDVDPHVRLQVAQNKNVPVESLIELATDNAPFVRKAVAINENTPAETLSILAVVRLPQTKIHLLMYLLCLPVIKKGGFVVPLPTTEIRLSMCLLCSQKMKIMMSVWLLPTTEIRLLMCLLCLQKTKILMSDMRLPQTKIHLLMCLLCLQKM